MENENALGKIKKTHMESGIHSETMELEQQLGCFLVASAPLYNLHVYDQYIYILLYNIVFIFAEIKQSMICENCRILSLFINIVCD